MQLNLVIHALTCPYRARPRWLVAIPRPRPRPRPRPGYSRFRIRSGTVLVV